MTQLTSCAFFAEKMMNSSCTPGSPDLRINILKATVPNAMMMLSPTVSKATVPNAMMMPSPTVTLMDEPSPSTAPLVWVVVLVVGLVTCVTIAMAGMTLFIVCKKNEKQQVTECAKSRFYSNVIALILILPSQNL